jgi:hypothetical protein
MKGCKKATTRMGRMIDRSGLGKPARACER